MKAELKAGVEEENDLWSRKRRLPTNGDHRRHTLINGLFTALQGVDEQLGLTKIVLDHKKTLLASCETALHDTEARLQVAVEALSRIEDERCDNSDCDKQHIATLAIAKIKEMEGSDV